MAVKNKTTLPKKTITLELVGLNGNAFALMGAFQKQAQREGWTKDEIKAVLDECMNGDYNHLLVTLMTVCVSPDESDPDYEEDDYDFDYEDD